VLREANLLILIQYAVHKRSLENILGPTSRDDVGVLFVELIHLLTHVFCAGFPHSEETFWDVVEEGNEVNGRRVAGFHHFRPVFHESVEFRHMWCICLWGADAKNWS